ncbi:hypothetical protein C7974DRAFT_211661 [Boeremia exigua]|uniref:uncharacterized protein n=1 Tax=Boeremia exigua TaxID=749465 RepID=UPI001E8D7B3A|nr:uncharacterized protein C7974DRAFT_211661 [Boeremia exigua]KAH6621826.1 hypothetical protein C7974DRAFT_211661 [Boeremia exigua]
MERTTLIIHHTFTGLALVIMALRVVCRRLLFSKSDFGDFCTIIAMLCTAARGGMIHIVTTWGTNNISAPARARINFTPEEIYRRTVGSKLAIANRPVYNTYLWLQKLVLLHFFLRTFHNSRIESHRYIFWSYGFIFLATWTAAQIVGFTECDPVYLYWQVVPSPGRCVQAQVQLVVLGVLNIVTDFMLLALPIPTLLSLQTPWRTKLRLCTICMLGLFIIVITIIRLPINSLHAAVQANRSIWASTELLAAAIAVNAPTLYGAINRWRRRPEKGSHGSRSRQTPFSGTRTVGSYARPLPRTDDDDDEGLILSPGFQATVSSGFAARNCEDGIIMKTIEVSYDEAHSSPEMKGER